MKVFVLAPRALPADFIRHTLWCLMFIESHGIVGIYYIYFFFYPSSLIHFFFLKFSVKVHHFLRSLIDIICSLCGEYMYTYMYYVQVDTRFTIIDYSNTSTPSEGVYFAFNPYLCACVTCIFRGSLLLLPRPTCMDGRDAIIMKSWCVCDSISLSR